MNEIQTRMERLIDEATKPFNAHELHRLSAEIEVSKILLPMEKEMLQRRVKNHFEAFNAIRFSEGPCGWRKEAA